MFCLVRRRNQSCVAASPSSPLHISACACLPRSFSNLNSSGPMDRQRNFARAHPALREFCSEAFPGVPGSAGSATFNKHGRTIPHSSAPFSSWTSYKMKHRRNNHYSHRIGQHRFSGGSWAFSDSRGHYPQRQFSEDSGFSSCGSSASSIADDSEVAGVQTLSALKASLWPSNEKKVSVNRSAAYSGTVASVLAAGISSDFDESDEEKGDYIPFCQIEQNLYSKDNVLCKLKYSPMEVPSSYPENMQVTHSGRNILDLGVNLQTQFPLQASKLPERNLQLYLLNRSQYHRLGKFGTSETLLYANCKNVCGFAYPVPPNEGALNNHQIDKTLH